MKHIVESVEEMYHARQPTGEVIVDEVINILRNYKLIYMRMWRCSWMSRFVTFVLPGSC